MISPLINKLFPDQCQVIYCPSIDRWVYPIFKNGSTMIQNLQKKENYPVKENEDIADLDIITVIIRDPVSRFVSGYNSCLYLTMRDFKVDQDTARKIIDQDPFVDRHVTPQYNWLSHLALSMKKDCKLEFKSMDHLQQISTEKVNEQSFFYVSSHELNKKFDLENNPFTQVDQVLYDSIDQSMTFNDINLRIKFSDPQMYHYLFNTTLSLAETHALPKT